MLDDHTEPMKVRAIDGSVTIYGPARMEGAFTADAAEESAMRLLIAASEARAQLNPAPLQVGRAN